VSCLGVSNDGISLCTGSWDSLVSLLRHCLGIPTNDSPLYSSRFGPGKPKTKRKIPRVDHSAMLFFDFLLDSMARISAIR
jgi:hypothetical protein